MRRACALALFVVACSNDGLPVVDSFEQSSLTAAGNETVTFTVKAHDPDGSTLRYTWNANGGQLGAEVAIGGGSQIDWISPACAVDEAPTMLISVSVSDPEGHEISQVLGVTSACPTCSDHMQNGSESDIDCGGPDCLGCKTGDTCTTGADCASSSCATTCQPPACDDHAQNGDETGIDCGGSCGGCDDGNACMVAADCLSKVCTSNVCIAATCTDGVANGHETAMDCGGDTCAPCGNGLACLVPSDCAEQTCINHLCVAPTCIDNVMSGGETDVDCGGPDCAPCDLGEMCLQPSDCVTLPHASHACASGHCALDTCVGDFLTCDMDDTNGCETPRSLAHCDSCTSACTTGQLCELGQCVDPKWSSIASVTRPVSIAISPNGGGTPYVIYVGTNGDGVFHSADGTTWASSGPATTTALSPMPNAAVCFAALPDATVQVTANSGGTYSSSGSSGSVLNNMLSVAGVGPFGAAGDGSGHAVLVHGLGPAGPWVASNPFGTGVGTSLASTGTQTIYIGVNGSDGGVYVTANAGGSPPTITKTALAQNDVLSVAVAPSAGTHVFAGTNGEGIFRSLDSGATWAPASTGLVNLVVRALVVDRTNANNVYAGTENGVFVSKDGGDTWASSPGLVGWVVTSLAVLNGTPSTVYAATNNGFYVTTTGGQ